MQAGHLFSWCCGKPSMELYKDASLSGASFISKVEMPCYGPCCASMRGCPMMELVISDRTGNPKYTINGNAC